VTACDRARSPTAADKGICAFDISRASPLTFYLFFIYESSGSWKRWARACAGVEAAAVAAGGEVVLRAGKWWYCRGRRVSGRRHEGPGFDHGLGSENKARSDCGRAGIAPDFGRCGRLQPAWVANFRANQVCGTARRKQKLHERV